MFWSKQKLKKLFEILLKVCWRANIWQVLIAILPEKDIETPSIKIIFN